MAGTIEALIPGGEATPGPPLGPELGPTRASPGGATRRRERRAADGHRRARRVAHRFVADDDETSISQKETLF